MTVTEIGCMGVKPDLDVMNDATQEGQILTEAWKAVTTALGGPHRVYWGLEIEDPSKVWAFFDWDTIEDHEKFAKSSGSEAVKDLPTILTHGEFTKHITVTPSPPLVLQSPVTEVMLAYFPSDISQAEKEAAAAQFQQFVEKSINKCSDTKGVSSGWGVENDFPIRGEGQKGSIFIALIGWHGIDARMKFRETDGFKKNVDLIRNMDGVVKLTMFHLSCRDLAREN